MRTDLKTYNGKKLCFPHSYWVGLCPVYNEIVLRLECLTTIQSTQRKKEKMKNKFQHFVDRAQANRKLKQRSLLEKLTKPRTNSSRRTERISWWAQRVTQLITISLTTKSYLPTHWLSRKWEVWLNFKRTHRC